MNSSGLIIACIALVIAPARAGVIVVDAAGARGFTEIQPAIDAASDGDTILVKTGSYGGFTIDGKGLTVVGDAGPLPIVAGAVVLQNIAQGKTLVLARIQVTGDRSISGPPAFDQTLLVDNCAGAVRCVECEFHGFDASESVPGGTSVVLSLSDDVAFGGCKLLGGDGFSGGSLCLNGSAGSAGGSALRAIDASKLALYDCTLVGGAGGSGGAFNGFNGGGGAGGLALQAADFTFLSRTTVSGGRGGDASCWTQCPGSGGDAFALSDAVGWQLNSFIFAGQFGGQTSPPLTCPPDNGELYPDGTPFQFATWGVGFSLPSVAREGEDVLITFTSDTVDESGLISPDPVFLNDSLSTTFEGAPSWRGVLLAPFPTPTPGPQRERRWGVVPPSTGDGVLSQVYRVPQLPPGVQAQTRFLQAYRKGPGGITLGGFRTLTVLDSEL
jgi:hypothetical protein